MPSATSSNQRPTDEALTPLRRNSWQRDLFVGVVIAVGMVALFLAPPVGWGLVVVAAVFAATGLFGLSRAHRIALAVFAGAGILTTALLALLLLPAGVRV
ncbi:hypothetical protein [Microbacterium sp. NPDC089695]|uniref:hypothetical protein n=1 Tax=Microbacterium sp. NPDC089695 TaxID=3364198 RepID=UPI0038237C29